MLSIGDPVQSEADPVRRRGRREWKKQVGYHRRSLSETAMYRMKTCFGEHLKNREMPNQQTEVRLRCKILNRFSHLGLPLFEWNGLVEQLTHYLIWS